MSKSASLLITSIIVCAVFTWSVINPHDLFTWFLEVFPAIIGIGILAITFRTFQFTHLVYFLIAIHAIVLMIGGHYTYAEVPLFNWIRDTFHQTRNNYDKVGHFIQGFVPAIIARELLLRTSSLKRGRWLFVIVVSICLAISAAYELFEWGVAVSTGTAADAFLGSQGDPWDTQSDMAFALFGAVSSLLLLEKIHDKQLLRINV